LRKISFVITMTAIIICLSTIITTGGLTKSSWYSKDTAASNLIPGSCTIFAASYGNTVLYGNNEDYSNYNTYYWAKPSTEGKYGGVYLGFDNFFPQGGINEKGLASSTVAHVSCIFFTIPSPSKSSGCGFMGILGRALKS